jgi:uncharacterized protein
MDRKTGQFALWQAAIQQRATANEDNRRRLLAELVAWLDTYAAEYGVDTVWIFGSLTRPGHFDAHSDIDIALGADPQLRQFRITAELSQTFDRDVDVILLDECPFAVWIVKEGIPWIQSSSAH